MKLNTEKALAKLGNDISLYQFLMQSLIDELPLHIEELKKSRDSFNTESAARTAHVIKGHLLMFGCEIDAATCNHSQNELIQCQHHEACQALITPLIEITSSFLLALKSQ